MIGVVLMILVLLVAIPVGFLVTMSGLAALLGTMLKKDVDANFEGSELLEIA